MGHTTPGTTWRKMPLRAVVRSEVVHWRTDRSNVRAYPTDPREPVYTDVHETLSCGHVEIRPGFKRAAKRRRCWQCWRGLPPAGERKE